MKLSIRKGAVKAVAVTATPAAIAATVPARSWSQRDYPIPTSQRNTVKTEARTSMHFRIISRTGK